MNKVKRLSCLSFLYDPRVLIRLIGTSKEISGRQSACLSCPVEYVPRTYDPYIQLPADCSLLPNLGKESLECHAIIQKPESELLTVPIFPSTVKRVPGNSSQDADADASNYDMGP
ncbi:unnamed protein product [Arctia plantaginis]|uniref:Uncharacterized protein n=1 Tax=Arctia plantaginis TaxID=874455 RepID=A0A8S1AQA7_ARCPL|nr:unnamed protein product [Arctia plantaginis]